MDLRGQLEKMSKYLGKDLSEDQMDRLREHLQFENVKKNESINMESGKKIGMMNKDGSFIRKGNFKNIIKKLFLNFHYLFFLIGKVGDWKNHFSPEMNKKLDLWIEKNLAGTDLKFVTELEVQD